MPAVKPGLVKGKGSLKQGIRLYQAKKWDESITELLQVDSENLSTEEEADLAYYLGLCCTKLKRYEDALTYLEQVVTANVNQLRICQCRLALAYIYVLTKRSKMAEFELQRLTNNGFESAQLYCTLGYAAWTQKHYKESISYYEKALKLDARNTTALNGLGYVLVEGDIDLRRGLNSCKKAVDISPHNAAYLDSLGWAYYKSGNILEARTWLRRAAQAGPGVKDIEEHLHAVTGAPMKK
jgi:tetratricopeptide (TPR) repeat protein